LQAWFSWFGGDVDFSYAIFPSVFFVDLPLPGDLPGKMSLLTC
jgi:hypothetical protein